MRSNGTHGGDTTRFGRSIHHNNSAWMVIAFVCLGCGENNSAARESDAVEAQPGQQDHDPDAHQVAARVVSITPERFFPEGVAVDRSGRFYIGSMELGAIYRATANASQAEPFIAPDNDNGLVSVLGLFVDDATDTLYVCSSDAGNAARFGSAPAAIKAFEIQTGRCMHLGIGPSPCWNWPHSAPR